jgi:hypothetical protein
VKNGRLKICCRWRFATWSAELIDRKKQGFACRSTNCSPDGWPRLNARIARFCDQTSIDRDAALNLVKTGQGSKTWYLLNLAMWWRHFIAQEPLSVS